ncbi:DUF551 domain-containing protein [Citrobacter youngae]|nr:DUF551 domain-containing protein [Citrobacter youngae]
MTTNNHSAHGPVSLDRLHQISEILSKAAAQSDSGNLGYAMADAVKVIDELLSVRKTAAQEAVYQVLDDGSWTDYSKQQLEVLLESKPSTLFRVAYPSPSLTQLAPVVADAVKVIDGTIAAFGAEPVLYAAEETLAYAKMGELHLKCLSQPMGDAVIPLYTVPPAPVVDADDNFYSWFGREWEQYYQPNNYSLSAKKHLGAIAESAWFACRAAMLQAGNSPVTPDGWIPVSERMPNDKDFVWCYGYVSGWTESDGFEAYYDATRNKWWTIDDETVRKVTHWMPLPAAPRQEE